MLKNATALAIGGIDTAGNGPSSEVTGQIRRNAGIFHINLPHQIGITIAVILSLYYGMTYSTGQIREGCDWE